jgi:hypothetical protein
MDIPSSAPFCRLRIQETFDAYSCGQKSVPLLGQFFLQPLIPSFRISELIFEKRYKSRKRESKNTLANLKKRLR